MTGPNLNHSEGMNRLAIAVGVPWAAIWAYRLWRDYQNVELNAFFAQNTAASAYAFNAQVDYAASVDKMCLDAAWAIGVPLAIAMAIWVRRGFIRGINSK